MSVGTSTATDQVAGNGLSPITPLQKQRFIRETIGRDPYPIGYPEGYRHIVDVYGFAFGRVDVRDAIPFIEKYEWLGYAGRGRIAYGIWRDKMLYGVELFSILPPFLGRLLPYEIRYPSRYLSRGACCLEAGPHAASALIGACLRDLKKNGCPLVVAFSDPAAGEKGTIYKATNASFAGYSNVRGRRYVKIDGKWYSNSSLYSRFKTDNYHKLPPKVIIEEIKRDTTMKKRWIWVLDPKILPNLPNLLIPKQEE